MKTGTNLLQICGLVQVALILFDYFMSKVVADDTNSVSLDVLIYP